MAGASAGIAAASFTPTRVILGTGGLSAAQACYDCRSGVAVTGTAVNSWKDYRGSAAPASASTMSPSGTGNAPTQAAALNSPVVTASGNKVMIGANTTTLLSTGNGSVAVIGLCATATAVMGGVSGNFSDLIVGTNATDYVGIQGDTDVSIDTGISKSSSTVRVVCASQNGSAGSASVANHTPGTGTVTNGSNPGPNFFVLAAGGGAFAATSATQAYFGYCSTAIWTTVQLAYLALFGKLRFGAVPAT